MKPGSVFKVKGEEQLYFADAVTPSGSVYAHRFDMDKGAFGEPVVLSPGTELEIVLNTLQPEKEEGYEYCEIEHRVRLRQGWPVKEWYEAEAEGPTGKYTAGTSKALGVMKGDTILPVQIKKSEAIHQRFVSDLLSDGWELVHVRGRPWYQQRFKRKIGTRKRKRFILFR